MHRRVLLVVVVLGLIAVSAGFLVLKSRRRAPQEAGRAPAVATVTAGSAPRPESAQPPAAAPLPSAAPVRRTPKAAAPVPVSPPSADAAAETATLHITSDVPGAQVFIDRQYIGAAPVTAEHITPGIHQLNASVEGFDGVVQRLDIAPGPRDVAVRFREVRLDATLDVIHKHRLGSCTGRLRATPAELRYETANKDDGFSVPLGEVESLQVDYLQKNLRVKLRQGRQYNFTDPDGNADRLFVFQRDVDKARQRLARGDEPAGN